MQRRTPKTRGFTLIEVLIALVVLSIGLLGTAGIQLQILRLNHQGFMREQAVNLAQEMSDRMRANVPAFNSGSYDQGDGANYESPTNNSCTPIPGTASVVCTGAEMAAHDRFEWAQDIGARLVSGAGAVCIDSDPLDATVCDGIGTAYWVNVSWTEIEGTGNVTKSYNMRFAM